MKKIILAVALLTLTSSVAYSEESEPELMAASSAYVTSLLIQCKEYAIEDGVVEPDMNGYLLTCINDELEASFYKTIEELPSEG
ncbi:MAG: hypothetical protein ACI9LM_003064 [Alteromonadaceae bacterium]|jgi:hypothetical protein